MFAVVELGNSTKDLMIIATDWLANEKKNLVNIPILDDNLESVDPAFKKLKNVAVFKQSPCTVLHDDIENIELATRLLESEKEEKEKNKNKRKCSSETDLPIKKRKYSLNLGETSERNEMENETDHAAKSQEEVLLVQMSDIESDQATYADNTIPQEDESFDVDCFKDQIFMKINELEAKVDCLIEYFRLNPYSMKEDPVVPELDFKTLEEVAAFDERLKSDQHFLNKLVHYFIYRVQSGRFHKAYYGKVACMLKKILNQSIYSAFKYSRKSSTPSSEGDDDQQQQKVSFGSLTGILNLLLEVCNHKSEEIVDDRSIQNAVCDFFQKYNKTAAN